MFNILSKDFPKGPIIQLTLLNQCFGQQSNSETQVAYMNTAGAAGVHHKSYVPILHSFYTHIHKNLTFNNCISCCSAKSLHSTPLSVADTPLQGSLHVPSVMRTHNHIQITVKLCQ